MQRTATLQYCGTVKRNEEMKDDTSAETATDLAVTSRKTIEIKALTDGVFDFDLATVSVTLFTGGIVEMEFDGVIRSGKGGRKAGFKSALARLIGGISLKPANAADYEVTDGDWQDVSNAPEYHADEENAPALKKLSATVEKAGATLIKAGVTSRASVMTIGAALNTAHNLLGVASGGPTDKPALVAWGKWIEQTPFANAMFTRRRASISEYRKAATMPEAVMGILPDNLNSAKAINNFNDAGYNLVAKMTAAAGHEAGTLVVAVESNTPFLDFEVAGTWTALEAILDGLASDGVTADKAGTAYVKQTDEQKEADEPQKVNAKAEAHRQDVMRAGVFAGVIWSDLDDNDIGDEAFKTHKFGKVLAKHLRALRDAPSDEEKRAEDTEEAADKLANLFEDLTAEQAAGHIATLCASRLDVAEVLAMAQEIWTERYEKSEES